MAAKDINMIKTFKALSDDTRLKIVEMLIKKEYCACDLLKEFSITQPTLSYHMKMLTDAGIVEGYKSGIWVKYKVNSEAVSKICGFLGSVSERSQPKEKTVMKNKADECLERHANGYNCAQAVACTYCESFGMSEDDAFRIMEGFGHGMGACKTCGALSGAVALVGLKNSIGLSAVGETKKQCMQTDVRLVKQFEDKIGSSVCGEILRANGKRVCEDCIRTASSMIEDILLA